MWETRDCLDATTGRGPRDRIGVFLAAALLVASAGTPGPLAAQQLLETETARLPASRVLVVGTTFEYQTSGEGTERAVPLSFEYGLAPRWALLVEPVVYTAIRPIAGRRATGPGDLEVTLQFLARDETGRVPALAIAAEVKLPTASDRLIGTGRTDVTPYLIASKRISPHTDLHANIGYSFVGRPPGIDVQNTLNVAVAVEYHATPRLDVVGEALSTTAASAEGGGETSASAPEVAGAEQVGMLGMRYALRRHTWASIGVTYDNTRAVLLRPGLTLAWPL